MSKGLAYLKFYVDGWPSSLFTEGRILLPRPSAGNVGIVSSPELSPPQKTGKSLQGLRRACQPGPLTPGDVKNTGSSRVWTTQDLENTSSSCIWTTWDVENQSHRKSKVGGWGLSRSRACHPGPLGTSKTLAIHAFGALGTSKTSLIQEHTN